jgi:uncharacterized membrane protein
MSATDYDASDDRTLPMVVYALYLIGLIAGVTVLIGLIIAYANRARAGFMADSHYLFQIRTFWIGLALWLLGGVSMMWGALWGAIPFIGLVGVPFVMLGLSIFFLTHLWFAVRCILGLVYVSRGDAYPRPRAWLA